MSVVVLLLFRIPHNWAQKQLNYFEPGAMQLSLICTENIETYDHDNAFIVWLFYLYAEYLSKYKPLLSLE